MNCKWEELTCGDFARTVQAVGGVCLVPLGVLEKHGDHLPLGTDMFNVRCIAERAVRIEPAMLFPPYYFSQIQEAKHCPGTLAVPNALVLSMLEAVCNEIARNGMKKIILLSGHGGNNFLDLFLFSLLEKPRDYVVYKAEPLDYYGPVVASPEWKAMEQGGSDYHGGERETSVTIVSAPGTVRMDLLSESGQRQGRLDHLEGLRTSMWWYADYPNHYAGDGSAATVQKGEFVIARCAKIVARYIRTVREDTRTAELQREYFSRLRHDAPPTAERR